VKDAAPGIDFNRLFANILRIKPKAVIVLCFDEENYAAIVEGQIVEDDVLSAMDVLDAIQDMVVQGQITPTVDYTGNA
jgi:DNA integrity scanning protein DisA with diadenylate cyclase activity